MKLPSLLKFCIFATLVYVTLGDAFLPQPYSTNSKQMRSDLNQYLVSLFPKEKLENFKQKNTKFNGLDRRETGSTNPRFR